jgi:hypothetical protein
LFLFLVFIQIFILALLSFSPPSQIISGSALYTSFLSSLSYSSSSPSPSLSSSHSSGFIFSSFHSGFAPITPPGLKGNHEERERGGVEEEEEEEE